MPAFEGDMIEPEQRYRASAYGLLAALLREPPDASLLDHLTRLSPEGDADADELQRAMAALADAALDQDPAQLEDEFNTLFIGIGKGEVVPYGSWYRTGFLMEQPLSDLRDDLRVLGYERSVDTHEPEDHVAALFEVISVMISDPSDISAQRRFYETHLEPWIGRFFGDLGSARSAKFYQTVARFGAAFTELERAYLSMQS